MKKININSRISECGGFICCGAESFHCAQRVLLRGICWVFVLSMISSCAQFRSSRKAKGKGRSGGISAKQYVAFQSSADYPETLASFQNSQLLESATPDKTSVRIDLATQRILLMVGDQVAIDAPCCTGKAGKRTPTGRFPIIEKLEDKRSNIFGTLYNGSRAVHVGDRRRYSGASTSYVGYSLPKWMRLTNDGVGIHQSAYVHRKPGSNGCVRVPEAPIAKIFEKVGVGTPVMVTN